MNAIQRLFGHTKKAALKRLMMLLILPCLTLPAFAQDTTAPCNLPADDQAYANYIERGDTAAKSGDYSAAVTAYTCAIELKPNDALAYNSRGKIYVDNLAAYDLAIADFTRAIELDPANAQLYNRRGWSLYQQGEYPPAISDFTRAIQLRPEYALAFNNRGIAYRALANYEGAKADINRAISLGLTPAAWGYANLGFVYLDIRDLPLAEGSFRTALQHDPAYADAHLGLGDTYYVDLRYDQALEAYRQYLQLMGDKAAPNVLKRVEEINNRNSFNRTFPGIVILVATGLALIVGGLYWRERRRTPPPPLYFTRAAVSAQPATPVPTASKPAPSKPATVPTEAKVAALDATAVNRPLAARSTPLLVVLPIVALAVGAIVYVLARDRTAEPPR